MIHDKCIHDKTPSVLGIYKKFLTDARIIFRSAFICSYPPWALSTYASMAASRVSPFCRSHAAHAAGVMMPATALNMAPSMPPPGFSMKQSPKTACA